MGNDGAALAAKELCCAICGVPGIGLGALARTCLLTGFAFACSGFPLRFSVLHKARLCGEGDTVETFNINMPAWRNAKGNGSSNGAPGVRRAEISGRNSVVGVGRRLGDFRERLDSHLGDMHTLCRSRLAVLRRPTCGYYTNIVYVT